MLFSSSLTLLFGALVSVAAASTPDAQSQITKSRFGTITFNTTGNIVRATVFNPPLNIIDAHLLSDINDFLVSLAPGANQSSTAPPKVAIFASNHSSIWINHIDINQAAAPITPAKQAFLAQYGAVTRLLQSINTTVFVAEVNGVGWGAGLELAVQMDLRYAGPGARIGSIENALGETAGAGGQLFLGTLAGKQRALEHDLTVTAFDGPVGTAAGVFNADFTSADDLRAAVDQKAGRIALVTRNSINATKSALGALLNPSIAALDADVRTFLNLLSDQQAQTLIQKYLTVSKNQTSLDFELGGPDTYLALGRS